MEIQGNLIKAKEIAQNAKDYFYHDEYECGLACALRMAKWKDKQFEAMKEKIKVDTMIEVGYAIREKISNGASIMSLDIYARHLTTLKTN